MKKILSKLGVAAIIASAAIVAGCSNGLTTPTQDTIKTIEAPSLQGKTLPGVNYITWNQVNGAASYKVYRDGILVKTITTGSALEYADVAGISASSNNPSALVDGVEYTYDVIAVPSSTWVAPNTAQRTVYTEQNMSTIKLKADVPTATEFAEKYKDYYASFTKAENPTFKVEQVTAITYPANYIRITLETKPEFSYQIWRSLDNDPNVWGGDDSNWVTEWNSYKGSSSATEIIVPVTGAGEWNYFVNVAPRASIYEGLKVNAPAKISVPSLNVTTSGISAAYIDAGKTAKISWTADKDPITTNKFETTKYTVFRFANNTYTKLTGTVASETSPWGTVTYFITDTIADNTQSYKYYVVLSDGKYVADSNSPVTLSAYGIDSSSYGSNAAAAYIDEGKNVRITWKPAKNSVNTEFATTDYAVYRLDTGINGVTSYTAVSGTITASKIGEDTYYFVTDAVKDNTITNNYIIILAQKSNRYYTISVARYTPANAATPAITVNAINVDNDNYSNDAYVQVKAGKAGETIKVYKVNTTKVTSPSVTLNTVLDTDYTELDLSKFTGPDTSGYLVYVDKDLAEGTWKYMVEETATGKKAVRNSNNVTINSIPSVSGNNLSLSVNKYVSEAIYGTDNTIIQNAKFSIAVTDYVATTEKFDNYSYKIQYTKLEKVGTTGNYTYGAWKDIATSRLVNINTTNYKGAAEITLGEGAYYFRVVKTDSASKTEVIKYATGSYTVSKQYNTSSYTFSYNSTDSYVYVDTNKYYGNYKFALYQQTLKNNQPVTDYTAVSLNAFAETASGSGTYRAKYGTAETVITPVTAATEQKSYNYLLVITDKDDNIFYRTISGVYIK